MSLSVLFILLIFLFSLRKISDCDIWWHLALGKQISSYGALPDRDIYTIAAGDARFPSSEWLFEYIVYQIDRSMGVSGLVIFQAILATIPFGLLLMIACRDGLPVWISGLFLLINYVCISERLLLRPHLISFIGISFILVLIQKLNHQKSISIISWILIGFVFIAWVNCHPGVVYGILMVCMYLLMKIIFKSLRRDDVVLGVLVLLSSLMNPEGVRFIQYALIHVNVFSNYGVTEFMPPNWQQFPCFYVIVALFSVSCMFGISKLNVWQFIVAGVLCLLSFHTSRSIPEFTILAYSLIVPVISSCMEKFPQLKWFRTTLQLLISAATLTLGGYWIHAHILDFGLKTDQRTVPAAAVRFLSKHSIVNQIYNSMEFGGYIEYQIGPETKVFFDGRNLIFFDIWDRIKRSSFSDFQSILDEYQIECALVSYPRGTLKMSHYFIESNRWQLIFWDDVSMIFLKKTPENSKWLERFALDCSPIATDRCFQNNSEDSKRELTRVISESDQSSQAHDYLGFLYFQEGELSEARRCYNRSLEIDPTYANACYYLSVIDRREDNLSSSIRNLQACLRLQPDHIKANRDIGMLLLSMDRERAEKHLRRYLYLKPETDEKSKILNILEHTPSR